MTNHFAIVIDSAGDIPSNVMKKYDIQMVNAKVIIEEQEYVDRLDISREQIIAELRSKKKVYTSQPTPMEFARVFEKQLESYEAVLYLGISSKLSGTYRNAVFAAKKVAPKRIHCYDTGLVSYAVGILAYYAAIQRKKGKSLQEVIKELDNLYDQMEIYIMLSTLEYLYRGGRIGRVKALAGKILHMKPILTLQEGVLHVKKVVRSSDAAKNYIREDLKDFISNSTIALISLYGEYNVKFNSFINELRTLYQPKIFWYEGLSPVIMCHTGPETDALMVLKLPEDFQVPDD